MSEKSTHFDDRGNVHMVDVSTKQPTVRVATASSGVWMMDSTATMIRSGKAGKGDVLGVARIAAINATKQTQILIPLCHAIPVEAVTVDFVWPTASERADPAIMYGECYLDCRVTVKTTSKTGVEMEALTAASIACLTVYDMAKSVDRAMVIGPTMLDQKFGGKSGDFQRQS